MGSHGLHVKNTQQYYTFVRFLGFTLPAEVPAPLRLFGCFGAPSGDLLLCGFELPAAAGNLCDRNLLWGFEIGIAPKL